MNNKEYSGKRSILHKFWIRALKKRTIGPKIVAMLKTVAAIKKVFGTPWEKSRDMMLMNNHEYSGKNPPCQK